MGWVKMLVKHILGMSNTRLVLEVKVIVDFVRKGPTEATKHTTTTCSALKHAFNSSLKCLTVPLV